MKPLKESFIKAKDLDNILNRRKRKINPYNITEKDLKGKIDNWPLGVVIRCIEEQVKQGNLPDISVFQMRGSEYTDRNHGGFDWVLTEAGFDFWEEVLDYKKYDLFFKKYPEYR